MIEDATNLLHCFQQLMRPLSLLPSRPSFFESYYEKDMVTRHHIYLRSHRVRRSLKLSCGGAFRVVSRGTKTFRFKGETQVEVVGVVRPRAAVPDIPPHEPCCPLPPASPTLSTPMPSSGKHSVPSSPLPPSQTSSPTARSKHKFKFQFCRLYISSPMDVKFLC